MGQGYAVFAWAKAESVTHRIRKMMYAVNARSEEEVVPVTTITKLSSRSLRIAMATLLAAGSSGRRANINSSHA